MFKSAVCGIFMFLHSNGYIREMRIGSHPVILYVIVCLFGNTVLEEDCIHACVFDDLLFFFFGTCLAEGWIL